MTNEEFSNEFDVLLSTGQSGNSMAFDEYEKSVFLTKAQESVVTALYNGTLTGESFEETERARRCLSSLIRTYSTEAREETAEGLSEDSYIFSIPDDVLFITYESAVLEDESLGCANNRVIEVVPVTQDELYKTLNNPFKGPSKRRALRLDIEGNNVEIISKYNIFKYQIRYLSKPKPIILINLPDGIKINDLDKITECELDSALHRTVLEAAVQLALSSKVSANK